MDLGLKNKTVIVTGGTRGIGLQLALAFLSEGAQVAVLARNAPDAAALQKLSAGGSSFIGAFMADTTDLISLQAACDQLLEQTQKIDIVIANTGNGAGARLPLPAENEWQASWDTNFTSALHTARVFTPHLEKTSGNLLFISSIAGMEFVGAPTMYGVAKHAILSLSKSLSHRLAPAVRVNVLAPGNILTAEGTWQQKLEQNAAAVEQMLQTKVPMKRLGSPEEISNAALFLCSGRASFITGACLVADGGQTIHF
jgi:3-oxoacyl-[acyl-carrier protein] reductase